MGTAMGLGAELERLREGATSFDAFAKATSGDWRRMAAYLGRRWRVPKGVEQTDVEQELLLAAWSHVGTWDPRRGVPLERYVIWGASNAAKKWMARQRNSLRRDDKAPGRYPVPFSSFGEEGPVEYTSAAVEPEQHEVVERREQLTFVLAPLSILSRRVLLSVVASGGDLGVAARTVFADPEARVGSESEARRLVGRVVDHVLKAAKRSGSETT